MELSMTTDYVDYTDDPLPRLRGIADAGFSHVHWCHQWCTDHIYGQDEIDTIAEQLDRNGLALLDLHGPHGRGLGWGGSNDSEREAVLRRIDNRITMTGLLGGASVILHIPQRPSDPGEISLWRENLKRSLDELRPRCIRHGVRIALENMPDDDFDEIERLLQRYDPDFIGICYDSGHGNIGRDGLAHLQRNRDRLIAIHIHDNEGTRDSHSLPFTGTVDWQRLVEILASSSYQGCVSLESNMRGIKVDERKYLRAFSLSRSRWHIVTCYEKGIYVRSQ
jgi:sugar phosphate isomerase/epimerase